ncbi:MAG: hypothetical protein II062_04770 [Oscillospiraceae bacterium]|nr:hypothetical protein [Oscillospiraceae bacterium]
MMNTMTGRSAIRMLPPLSEAERLKLRHASRRRAIRNTILEALSTIGLGTCFILCAVMLLCAV